MRHVYDMTKPPSKAAKHPIAAKKARKGINGAQKGAAFERLMSRELSLWISAGKSDDLLWRTGGSGARSTTRFKRGGKHLEHQTSDVGMAHPDAKPFTDRFVVECKFYRQLDVHRLFYDPRASVIGAWWAKVRAEGESLNKSPILIIKGNTYPALALMRYNYDAAMMVPSSVVVHALNAEVMLLSELLDFPFTHLPKPQPRKTQRARLLLPLPDPADE